MSLRLRNKRLNSALLNKTGKSVGDLYDLGREIGEGAFSSVKLSVQKETGLEVAIKVISKKKATPQQLKDVESEVDILGKCRHPHIVQLNEVFQTFDMYYLVLEYVPGGELFEYMVQYYPHGIPETLASKILAEVMSAVSYLHSMNIVHRDLKPENVLLTFGPLPTDYNEMKGRRFTKLCDFGASKLLTETAPLLYHCIGSPGYTAPEVLEVRTNADAAGYSLPVDLWSFGVVTFFLLSGTLPFYAENEELVNLNIQKGNYSFPSETWSNKSATAVDFIKKLLVFDPDQRLTADQALEHPWLKSSVETISDEAVALRQHQEQLQAQLDLPISMAKPSQTPSPTPSQSSSPSLSLSLAKLRVRSSSHSPIVPRIPLNGGVGTPPLSKSPRSPRYPQTTTTTTTQEVSPPRDSALPRLQSQPMLAPQQWDSSPPPVTLPTQSEPQPQPQSRSPLSLSLPLPGPNKSQPPRLQPEAVSYTHLTLPTILRV
eukprot:TRINITY_DN1732_c0_g5_i1.p1 TRINITY_DN1732_c0_g5~~TRINITY_DN1732_c0_g5_i1.p1  ORF type:complete len:487 (-),score=81.42 TRINITY_DN1732_c0_g5_i1:24-1484(-)